MRFSLHELPPKNEPCTGWFGPEYTVNGDATHKRYAPVFFLFVSFQKEEHIECSFHNLNLNYKVRLKIVSESYADCQYRTEERLFKTIRTPFGENKKGVRIRK